MKRPQEKGGSLCDYPPSLMSGGWLGAIAILRVMPNKKFNYHRYLAPSYLTRGMGNCCMKCGGKLGNISPDLRSTDPAWILPDNQREALLIGYAHKICPDQSDGDSITELK